MQQSKTATPQTIKNTVQQELFVRTEYIHRFKYLQIPHFKTYGLQTGRMEGGQAESAVRQAGGTDRTDVNVLQELLGTSHTMQQLHCNTYKLDLSVSMPNRV